MSLNMGLFTRKSLKDLQDFHEDEGSHLKRSLSTADLIFFGIGAIIGAGLFSITGVAAAENAGPSIVLAFIFAAIGCAFAGLCYSELATMIPVSGSAYTYAYASMGEFPAWLIGWSLILEYAIGAATVAISWSAYAVSFLGDLGIHLPGSIVASPWQPTWLPHGAIATGIINLPALFIVIILTFLLIKGVRQSAIVNGIVVLVKVAAVITFIAVGAFYINGDNLHPFIPENAGGFGEFGWSGILRASGVVFFAYIGFDAVSTTAQEAKTPQKSIPIGILGSLIICTTLYILFSFVLTGMVNYKDLNIAAPVALAISKTPFPWLHWCMKLAVLAGLTSVILVFLLGQSRIFYIMASDGLLPPILAKLHPTFQTPWISNLILMGFVGLIAAFTPISIVGHMTSIGTLLAFTIVCMGVIVLRYRHPEYPRPFKTPFFPWIPLFGIITCFSMMTFLGAESWLRLIVWLFIGLLVYIFYGRKHSHAS